MMQATQPWHRYDPAIHTELVRCLTASRGALPQREVCAVVVIQVGYMTPIKPVIAKCITVGTPGTGSRCTLKSKRDAEAVWYYTACKAK
jgi:hypothetical protein